MNLKNGNEEKIVLEEYCLNSKQPPDDTIKKALAEFIPEEMKKMAEGRITIISDEMFSYFCENACEVVTRIRVDDETGTVAPHALFNQEQAPSETLFYAVIGEQEKGCIDKLEKKISDTKTGNVIQIGGDATIGLGYCSVCLK